ncbi:hypothetical protein QTP88_015473 [Uroleucon formosanum]
MVGNAGCKAANYNGCERALITGTALPWIVANRSPPPPRQGQVCHDRTGYDELSISCTPPDECNYHNADRIIDTYNDIDQTRVRTTFTPALTNKGRAAAGLGSQWLTLEPVLSYTAAGWWGSSRSFDVLWEQTREKNSNIVVAGVGTEQNVL